MCAVTCPLWHLNLYLCCPDGVVWTLNLYGPDSTTLLLHYSAWRPSRVQWLLAIRARRALWDSVHSLWFLMKLVSHYHDRLLARASILLFASQNGLPSPRQWCIKTPFRCRLPLIRWWVILVLGQGLPAMDTVAEEFNL